MALVDVNQGGRLLVDEPPPVRILVVDDDAEDIYVLRRLLRRSEKFAYEVFACTSLDEGAAVAAALSIDVLLVDFFLGLGMSIDRRRANHAALSLPFILLSGLGARDLAEIAREVGAVGILDKGGLTVETVDALVRKTLDESRASLAAMRCPDARSPLPD